MSHQELNKITEMSHDKNNQFSKLLASNYSTLIPYWHEVIIKLSSTQTVLLDGLDNALQQISSEIPDDCVEQLLFLAGNLSSLKNSDCRHIDSVIENTQKQISSNNSNFLSGFRPCLFSDKQKNENETRKKIIEELDKLKILGREKNLVELATEIASPKRFTTAKSANSIA